MLIRGYLLTLKIGAENALKYSIEYFWIGLENLTTQTLTYSTVNIDTDTAHKLHENGCPKMFWEFSMRGLRLIEKI